MTHVWLRRRNEWVCRSCLFGPAALVALTGWITTSAFADETLVTRAVSGARPTSAPMVVDTRPDAAKPIAVTWVDGLVEIADSQAAWMTLPPLDNAALRAADALRWIRI